MLDGYYKNANENHKNSASIPKHNSNCWPGQSVYLQSAGMKH